MRKSLVVPQVLIVSLAASSLSAQTIVGAVVPAGLRGPVSNVVTGVSGYAAGQYFDSVARSVAPLPTGIGKASYASAIEFVGAAPVSLAASAVPVLPAAAVAERSVSQLTQKLAGADSAAFEAFFDGRASVAASPVTRGADFEEIRFSFADKPGWLEAELMKDMMRHSWDRQLWPFLRDSMGVSEDEVRKLTFRVQDFKADGLYQSARVSVSHPVQGWHGHFDYHLEKSSGKMRLRGVREMRPVLASGAREREDARFLRVLRKRFGGIPGFVGAKLDINQIGSYAQLSFSSKAALFAAIRSGAIPDTVRAPSGYEYRVQVGTVDGRI